MAAAVVGDPRPGNGFTIPSSPAPLDGGWQYTNGTESFGATDLQAGDLLVWQGLGVDTVATSPYDALYGLDSVHTEDGVAWDIDIDRKWYDSTIGAVLHLKVCHRWFASAPSPGYWAQFRADATLHNANFQDTTMLKIRGVGSNPSFAEFTPDGPFTSPGGVLFETYADGHFMVWSSIGGNYNSRVIGGNYSAMDGGFRLYTQALIGESTLIGSVYADAGGLTDLTEYGSFTPYVTNGGISGAFTSTLYEIALTDIAVSGGIHIGGAHARVHVAR